MELRTSYFINEGNLHVETKVKQKIAYKLCKSSSVSIYPGVGIGAVVSGDTWSTNASWRVLALSMGPVLADLSMIGIFTRNDDVFSDTLTDYGFL